jgi:hypothetical protein
MVADAITGNISPEATTQTGNIFADATRGGGIRDSGAPPTGVVVSNKCEGTGRMHEELLTAAAQDKL